MRCCGVDGCKGGWVIASRDNGAVAFQVVGNFLAVLALPFDVIAVDIPIGLPQSGARSADCLARQALGPRRNSVFNAPLRPMLAAGGWAEACRIGERINGSRITLQTWGIMKKIREVDSALTPAVRSRVFEVHPELSFSRMSEAPMKSPKKKREGRQERMGHLKPLGISEEFIREQQRFHRCQADDLLDALAALWSAERIAHGRGEAFPVVEESDARGLPMRIWA